MTEKRAVQRRLAAFRSSGESAQKLFLENGFWRSLNEWTKFAIVSRDVTLLKEIFNLLLKMPTTFPALTGPGGGLTLTVERLLKSLALEKPPEFREVEAKELKYLCAEVFARWLRLKKRNHEFGPDPQRVEVLTENGEVGYIAPIENRPGYGILAVKGKISVVELTVFRTPPPSPTHSISNSSAESEFSAPSPEGESLSPKSLSSVDEDADGSKVVNEEMKQEVVNPPSPKEEFIPTNKEKPSDPRIKSKNFASRGAPKIFVTYRSRSDNLLQSMLNPPNGFVRTPLYNPYKESLLKQKEVAVVRPRVDETFQRHVNPQAKTEKTELIPDVGGAIKTNCEDNSFHTIVNETPVEEASNETPIDEAPNETPIKETLNETPTEETLNETPIEETLNETPIEETLNETPLEETLNETPLEETLNETPIVETLNETPIEETLNETPFEEAPNETPFEEAPNETVPISTTSNATEAPPPSKKPHLLPAVQLPLYELETHHLLQNIEEDLGRPRKMVRWWGKDGVKDVHRYQRNEDHIARGYAKEKWTAIAVLFTDDELDNDYGPGRIKGHNARAPRSRSPVKWKMPVENRLPWKLTKIKIPPRKNPIIVDSREKYVQRRRERMLAISHNYDPTSIDNYYSPSSPAPEFDDNHPPVPIIPAHDVTDVPLLEDRTRIFDHIQDIWPEPKEELSSIPKPEKPKAKATKWSPLQFGFAMPAPEYKPRT